MIRTINLNPDRITNRNDTYIYMEELFRFQDDVFNLDALKDNLSEVTDDVTFYLDQKCLAKICADNYAYRVLLVLGKASEENPHLKIQFHK